MATSFENFVNTELPKRIATNESPTTPQAGDIPVFSGVGLLTESKTASEAGLATETFATNAANAAKSYADDLITSIYKFQTTYNPQTTGNFPTTANTVGGVAIKKGFTWVVSGVTGQYTFQGVTVDNGDTLLALVDNASATSAADWHITEKNLGYTPENQANKVNDLTDSTSTAKYTSVKAVVDGLSGKENTLPDVITANTYGSSTQYPKVTVNAKGIVTGVTLQTVPTPTFTDATFSVQKNGSPSIKASWSLTALTASHVHTYPDKDIDFGDLPSVATNDTNSIALAALRCRILGGQGNTVSGTDNVVVASSNCTVADTGNTVIGGYQCNNNAKTGTVLRGRKAIAYTDFEQVDCTYFGTAHSGGTRQFYDRFAPNVRTYNTYMFGDTTNLSVQNGFSLAFKPKAVIGLSMTDEPAAAFHKIRIVALKMGGAAGAASMEVSLVCRSETVGIVPFTTNNYFIVERVDSAVVGTAGIMGTFTFSIDSNGYLIIQKSSQSSDWGYFIYGTAYHTAT